MLDIHARLDPFSESGGAGALAYAAQSANSLKSTLGVHGDYLYRIGRNSLQPGFRLEYQHEFEGIESFALQYADWLNGPVYRASTDPSRRDHFVFGLGTDYRSKNLILSFDFKTDVDNGASRSSEVRAKAVWKFHQNSR